MVVKVKMDGLYVVSWLDAAGYMMEDLKAAKPCECVTVGWVKKVKKDHIVLASSYYPDDMITKTELLSPLPHSSAASSPPSLAVQQEH